MSSLEFGDDSGSALKSRLLQVIDDSDALNGWHPGPSDGFAKPGAERFGSLVMFLKAIEQSV
jgi:hypothetical protein